MFTADIIAASGVGDEAAQTIGEIPVGDDLFKEESKVGS
jgi:hypothetical protein